MKGVLVKPSDGPHFEEAIQRGSQDAKNLYLTSTNYLKSVRDGPPGQHCCACCGKEFKADWAPAGVYVVLGDGINHIAVGLCYKHATLSEKHLSMLLDETLVAMMLEKGFNPSGLSGMN
jgi:hypothetical protein